jgi:hypothetical protein
VSSDYWLGVASVPALVLAAGALWLVIKAVGWAGERLLTGGIIHLTSETPEARRAATASVLYGARRCWAFAPGDLAVVFVVGMDAAEVRKAADLLRPQVSLRDLRASANPAADEGTRP